MMNEDFVTYEQAVKLKELGFDWECGYYYEENTQKFKPNTNDLHIELSIDDLLENNNRVWNCVSAPTLSQVQKWLREVKGIDVHYHYGRKKWTYYWGRRWSQALYEEEYDTPFEALSAGIDKALEFLKEK